MRRLRAGFKRRLTQLAKQDVVVLDEFGYVPSSRAGAELLFDVVGQAYERQSLVVTTNLRFESWTESSVRNASPEPLSIGSPTAATS